jgi:hypothetical protein
MCGRSELGIISDAGKRRLCNDERESARVPVALAWFTA